MRGVPRSPGDLARPADQDLLAALLDPPATAIAARCARVGAEHDENPGGFTTGTTQSNDLPHGAECPWGVRESLEADTSGKSVAQREQQGIARCQGAYRFPEHLARSQTAFPTGERGPLLFHRNHSVERRVLNDRPLTLWTARRIALEEGPTEWVRFPQTEGRGLDQWTPRRRVAGGCRLGGLIASGACHGRSFLWRGMAPPGTGGSVERKGRGCRRSLRREQA